MADPNTVEAFTAYLVDGWWYLDLEEGQTAEREARIPTDPHELVAWLNNEGLPF